MQDVIFIKNIPTKAIVGIHDFEKVAAQKLIISVELGCDITQAAQADNVQYALDYDAISRFIDETVQNTQFDLIETLAEYLTAELFTHFSMQSIKLTIQKPGAIGYTQQVGLTICRERI